ncbi:MAG: hypothetical protein Q7J67_00475 [bacterium]|nr:hypothetical protein [bacterium]
MENLGSFQLIPEQKEYWYAHARIIPRTLSADGKTVVEALNAEGVPAGLTYRDNLIPEQKWFVNKETFGKSKAPWCYYKDRKYNYDIKQFPNVIASLDAYFRIPVKESWTLKEADDYVDALSKIHTAFRLKSSQKNQFDFRILWQYNNSI